MNSLERVWRICGGKLNIEVVNKKALPFWDWALYSELENCSGGH
jgi:hypothetical protein